MSKSFHEESFDEGTLIKLDVIRHYIREWLPVFMTKVNEIDIYDLFSGPGYDAVGNEGSPVILVKEIKQFCKKQSEVRSGCKLTLHFNDSDKSKIEKLQENLKEIKCEYSCCSYKYSSKDFKTIYSELRHDFFRQNPKLIIMDQFGVTDVTPEIISEISRSKKTDVLFFFPSSFIHRFREDLGEKIGLFDDEENPEYNMIHKHICSHFSSKLDKDFNYYLAPFSIKKGSNIYGLIFGSSHLLGLEKFLKVCWELDPKNGEANFNIAGESIYDGNLSLFEEDNVLTKIKDFKDKLIHFIKEKDRDNHDITIFCLSSGFSIRKAKEIISELQDDKKIQIISKNGGQRRKNAFYLGYNNIKEPSKVIYKGGMNGEIKNRMD